jgi:putative transposase
MQPASPLKTAREPVPVSAEDLRLMRLIDEEYLKHPHVGSRDMVSPLTRQGLLLNRKKMQRLQRAMGLRSLAPWCYHSVSTATKNVFTKPAVA